MTVEQKSPAHVEAPTEVNRVFSAARFPDSCEDLVRVVRRGGRGCRVHVGSNAPTSVAVAEGHGPAARYVRAAAATTLSRRPSQDRRTRGPRGCPHEAPDRAWPAGRARATRLCPHG